MATTVDTPPGRTTPRTPGGNGAERFATLGDLAKFTGTVAATPIPGLPDGHLRVVWDGRHDSPEDPEQARNALDGVVLIALLALAVTAVRAERSRTGAEAG